VHRHREQQPGPQGSSCKPLGLCVTHSRKAVWTAIGADLAIAAVKFAAFAFTRSSGMLSEAVHSLVDAGNGSLLIFGLHKGKRAPDESHPFGYGKELYFWTLLVALFIFIIGGGASFFEGITRIRHPKAIEHVLWSYLTLILAACFEGYSLWIGCREFRQTEGVSASWKAIHASKDPTTFTVIFEDTAALAGLFTAFVCTVLAHTFGWNRADAIASIVIGVLLVGVAILLIIESKALLVGEGADIATLQALRKIAKEQPGVVYAGYPLTMYFGPSNVLLTMNLRFDEAMGRDEIERAVDGVEARVRTQFPHVQHIYLEAESLQSAGKDFDYKRIPKPSLTASDRT